MELGPDSARGRFSFVHPLAIRDGAGDPSDFRGRVVNTPETPTTILGHVGYLLLVSGVGVPPVLLLAILWRPPQAGIFSGPGTCSIIAFRYSALLETSEWQTIIYLVLAEIFVGSFYSASSFR